jgi:hypothetical protein
VERPGPPTLAEDFDSAGHSCASSATSFRNGIKQLGAAEKGASVYGVVPANALSDTNDAITFHPYSRRVRRPVRNVKTRNGQFHGIAAQSAGDHPFDSRNFMQMIGHCEQKRFFQKRPGCEK